MAVETIMELREIIHGVVKMSNLLEKLKKVPDGTKVNIEGGTIRLFKDGELVKSFALTEYGLDEFFKYIGNREVEEEIEECAEAAEVMTPLGNMSKKEAIKAGIRIWRERNVV